MHTKPIKLATWNVNSLNVRLTHVLDWLRENPIDVLCLQETKQEDSKFPYDDLKSAGYNAVHNGQKTYNGVAIISTHEMTDVTFGMANFEDEQKRERERKDNICSFCDKNLSSKCYLNKHMQTCKKRESIESRNVLESQLQQQQQQYESQLQQQQQQYESQLQQQQQQYESQLERLQKQLDEQKELVKMYQNQILEIAKQRHMI